MAVPRGGSPQASLTSLVEDRWVVVTRRERWLAPKSPGWSVRRGGGQPPGVSQAQHQAGRRPDTQSRGPGPGRPRACGPCAEAVHGHRAVCSGLAPLLELTTGRVWGAGLESPLPSWPSADGDAQRTSNLRTWVWWARGQLTAAAGVTLPAAGLTAWGSGPAVPSTGTACCPSCSPEGAGSGPGVGAGSQVLPGRD